MDTVRKIILLKNLTGKLKSKSYCKNTSNLSFLPSQAKKESLGWGLHGNYTAFCCYVNLKYIEKQQKR